LYKFNQISTRIQNLVITFMWVLCLSSGALQSEEPEGGRLAAESSRRWISAGPISVDAVTGQIEMTLPVGPVLPGRIPIGFTYRTEGTGGNFDAYRWPNWDSGPTRETVVLLAHRPVRFVPGGHSDGFPGSELYDPVLEAKVFKWFKDRGITNGKERIHSLGTGYTAHFEVQVRTSEDGQSHLVRSAWKIRSPLPPKPWGPDTVWPPEDNRVFGARMAVIQGDTIIWTSFDNGSGEQVQQSAQPITEIRNRWGDWVSVNKSCNASTQILEGAVLTSSLGHSLTLSSVGTSWAITNNMGFATTSLQGSLFGNAPNTVHRLGTISVSGLAGNSWTFTWANERLTTAVSRAGAKYELIWSTAGDTGGVAAPADSAFDIKGNWKGFEPVKHDITWNIGTLKTAVNTIRTTSTVNGESGGSRIDFIRTIPKPSDYVAASKTITWASVAYQTEIRSYAQPELGTSYRFVRLIHAQPQSVCGTPSQPVEAQRQMLLFAQSSVVQELSGTMADGTETILRKLTHDGWSLKSTLNPQGAMPAMVLSPQPTRKILEFPGGDGPTQTTEYTDWNGRIYKSKRSVTVPSSITGHDGTGKPELAIWRGSDLADSEFVTGSVLRTAGMDAAWDADLIRLQVNGSNASVSGTDYATLRGVASVELGTKTYHYDSLGRTTSISGSSGVFTSELTAIPVDGGPEVSSTIRRLSGPQGAVNLSGNIGEEYQYSGIWRERSRKKPDPRWSKEERDGLGRITASVTPEGVRTAFQYDSFGRLWKTIREAKGSVAAVTTWTEWDPAGRWIREHGQGNDGSDLVKESKFDAFGRVVSVTTAKGNAAERTVYAEYDGFGQKLRESLPTKAGGTARFASTKYEVDGFVSQKKNTRGVVIATFARPARGSLDGVSGYVYSSQILRRIGSADVMKTEKVLKDILGQVVRIQDAKNQITALDYDAFGRVCKVTRGSQVRSYTYNEMGWLVSQTQPEEGVTTYENFTATGLPLKVTRGTGAAATTVLTDLYPSGDDREGLVRSVTASGIGTPVTRVFEYDSQRRLTSLIENNGSGGVSESYGYDDLSRLVDKTLSDGFAIFTVRRQLDAFGKVKRLIYPSLGGQVSRSVTPSYDPQHRLMGVAYGASPSETNLATMAYDQVLNGEEASTLTYANGAITSWQRNSYQELSRTTHKAKATSAATVTVVEDAAIAWANDGHMINRGADIFEYDELGRLSKSTVVGLSGEKIQQTFGYDLFGNRNSLSTVALAGTQPEEAVGYTLAIGPNNRLPGGTLTGASYDALGRLSEVWAVPGRSDTLTTWGYDAIGRVIHQGGAQSNSVEDYLLDGSGLRFRRVKSDGSVLYTVHGFDREPLSVFERAASPQTAVASTPVTSIPADKTSVVKTALASASSVTILSPINGKQVITGSAVAFQGSTTTGGTLMWTFGDGASAGGASVSHVFATAGNYSVTLKATYQGDPICKAWGPIDPITGERACSKWLPGTVYTVTTSITVSVMDGPAIGSFTTSKAAIIKGQESVTLAWSGVKNATALTLTPGSGGLAVPAGSLVVSPAATTQYTLTAANAAGSVTASVTISVSEPKPAIASFSANPSTITIGGSTTLSWNVANATVLSIDQGVGVVTGKTSVAIRPAMTNTYLYTITALGPGGTTTASTLVIVKDPMPVIATFKANLTSIPLGQSLTLSWTGISNAKTLTIDRGVGSVLGKSALVITPTVAGAQTYTLTAGNGTGTATKAISVTVNTIPSLTWKEDLVYGWGQLIFEKRGAKGIYQQGDHLGSPSILTNESGVVIGRQKALPFGERMLGSGEKSLRRFTNHEDGTQFPVYMQARMYLPSYGRFAQVDPAYDSSSGDGLNLYSYADSNPITQTDPDGMQIQGGGVMHLIADAGWAERERIWDAMAGGGSLDPAETMEKMWEWLNTPIELPVYHGGGGGGTASQAVILSDGGPGQSAGASRIVGDPGKDIVFTGENAVLQAMLFGYGWIRDTFKASGMKHNEYGFFVYQAEDGIHISQIVQGPSNLLPDGTLQRGGVNVDIAFSGIPRGAKMLADCHTHPTASWVKGEKLKPSDEDFLRVKLFRYYAHHPGKQSSIYAGYQFSSSTKGYIWRYESSSVVQYYGKPWPDTINAYYGEMTLPKGW
jgi:RHS repeat-associated protein